MSRLRSGDDFKDDVPEIEADIAKYEDSINLSSSIEAATEASPQFFFQTVYLLPNLILSLVRFRGLEELVSFKMLSIAFSFTSVAVSNYFIRFDTKFIMIFQRIVYQESREEGSPDWSQCRFITRSEYISYKYFSVFKQLNFPVRVTLSCVSRVLIFSSWMFVTFDGNFHPTATISAFYLTVLIMIIFNVVFNKSRPANILTFKYWIGEMN